MVIVKPEVKPRASNSALNIRQLIATPLCSIRLSDLGLQLGQSNEDGAPNVSTKHTSVLKKPHVCFIFLRVFFFKHSH